MLLMPCTIFPWPTGVYPQCDRLFSTSRTCIFLLLCLRAFAGTPGPVSANSKCERLIQPSANEERKIEDKCPHVPASGRTILSIPHMVSKKIPAGLAHSGHLLTCAPFITFSPVPVSPSPFPHLCFLRSPPVLVPALEKQVPRWD